MNGSNAGVVPRNPAKALGIALWAAQMTLGALFSFAGMMKFVMPVEEMTRGSSLPGSFFHFIGVMEALGAIGLILPSVFRISPFLTPVAACGLLIIMVGATVTSIPMGWISLFPFFVEIPAAFIAYGRFKLFGHTIARFARNRARVPGSSALNVGPPPARRAAVRCA